MVSDDSNLTTCYSVQINKQKTQKLQTSVFPIEYLFIWVYQHNKFRNSFMPGYCLIADKTLIIKDFNWYSI